MYPLWGKIIAPVLRAAGARRVVEIGALQGETTVKLLDLLGPESEVHVIDPVPHFDPSEHERRFPGRYHFHRAISHDVLPELPAVDAALIDGDHNWYTVYNELKMLGAAAREAGAPLPVCFLHDVGWPYGRRDLYYAPERIPEEFRQPWAQKGLPLAPRGGRTALLERGGFNQKMNNALEEGGPHNGVMTAVEDFVAEHDRRIRLHVVPIYFGLAILVDEQRIAERPKLGPVLDRFDDPAVLRELLELSERMRIKEMRWGQIVFYTWQERLDLLGRHYLELLRTNLDGAQADLDHALGCLDAIREEKVDGDLVTCGADAGDAAVLMRGYLQAHHMGERTVWVAGANSLRERLDDLRLLDDRVTFISQASAVELAEAPIAKAALVRVGADAAPGEALSALYEKLTLGGFVVVEGGDEANRRAAVDRFREAHDVGEPLESIGSGVGWRKVG